MSLFALLIQKVSTWKNFSHTERRILIQALILLPLVNLSLKLWGLKRTHSLLRNMGDRIQKTGNRKNSASFSQILTTANTVKIAAKSYNRATCLRKSLVLWYLLHCQGITAELQIGTRFDRGEFQAHAWVEYQGYVVGDRQNVQQHFASFKNLNTNLSKTPNLPPVPQLPTYQPEIELLLCCTKTQLDIATSERIESLRQQNIDWHLLLQLACQHGVFLLFYQNILQNYPECIPNNIQPHLQAYSQIKTARNLFLSKKLCQILEVFEKNSINVIPFKGSVLAASAYKNLVLREFCDIDLIIRQEDFPKVKDLLNSQNYQPRSDPQQWGQDFANQDDSIHLDIHWQLAPPCFPYQVDFQQLWQRRETISILNQQLTNLSPEDSLLILCLQIVKDAHYRQEKLKQICDIAQLIQTSSICWEIVIQQSQSLGSEKLLLFGLALTQELLHVEIPLEIKHKIASDRIVNRYLNHVKEQLFAIDNQQKKIFGLFDGGLLAGLYAFTIRSLILLDHSQFFGKQNRDLLGHLLSYLLVPNYRDLEYISLPPYLYFLYYLIRPIRLTSKFFKSSSKASLVLPDKIFS